MKLHGIHHIALVTADVHAALDFYGDVLGLWLLDEARDADGVVRLSLAADPGGETLILEQRPGAPTRQVGRGALHRIGWWVADHAALRFWARRLIAAGARPEATTPSFGHAGATRQVGSGLRFTSPEGTEHELIAWTGSTPPPLGAAAWAEIPREHALLGFAGLRAFGGDRIASGDLLAGRLGFATAAPDTYAVAGPERVAEYGYDDPPRTRAVLGTGSIAHVAWACNGEHLRAWRQRVIGLGARLEPATRTPWYRAIRFREPAGAVFEIAAP